MKQDKHIHIRADQDMLDRLDLLCRAEQLRYPEIARIGRSEILRALVWREYCALKLAKQDTSNGRDSN